MGRKLEEAREDAAGNKAAQEVRVGARVVLRVRLSNDATSATWKRYHYRGCR